MTPKTIPRPLPDPDDNAGDVVERITDAACDADGHWPSRIKQAFSKAGFAVHRLKREEHHPVWLSWLSVGPDDLPADKKLAARRLRKSLGKAGLQIGRDELTVLEVRRGQAAGCRQLLASLHRWRFCELRDFCACLPRF